MQPLAYRPPPRAGMSPALIAVLVVVGVLGTAATVGFMAGFMENSVELADVEPPRASFESPLTETYTTKNGLAVMHYPADFAAQSIDDGMIMLRRNLDDGTDEGVIAAAIPDPISDDVNEIARLLVNAMAKKLESSGDTWTETSRSAGVCFRGHQGVVVHGTYAGQQVRACFFTAPGRAYEVKTIAPIRHEAQDLPLLQKIADATELK
jgi:hypothetical protein